MRIAVIGLGAIGRLVADTLASQAEVVRIDRSSTPPRDPAGGGAPTERSRRASALAAVALVCVKTPGTAWAARIARDVLEPDGIALTLQNGLGNLEVLAETLGRARVGAGSVHSGAYLDEGGRVVASGPLRLTLARGALGERIDTLARLLLAGGAEVAVVEAAAPLLWRKAVVNAAVNPVTAILGLANGELPDHPAAALVADGLAAEAARVATSAGTALGEAEVAVLWRQATRATATNISSMLKDVRAGRVTEIDAICGAIAREGERRGVAAPLNAAIALLIHALEPAGS